MGVPVVRRNYRKPVTLNRYALQGAHFDGSTFLDLASIAATNNQYCSFSGFFRLDPLTVSGMFICNIGAATGLELDFTGNQGVNFFTDPGPGSLSVQPSFVVADGEWHHYIASVDCSATRRGQMLVDGVDRGGLLSLGSGDQTYPFNGLECTVGCSTGELQFLTGDIADLWVAPGVNLLDASGIIPPATLAKFYNAGYPVFLGANGERPTGTAPAVFLSGGASTFGTNRGTGGAFTTTGTLTDSGLVAPFVPTSWDTTQLGAHLLLSNGNLTATGDGSGVVQSQTRSKRGQTTGVRYYEVTIDISSGSAASAVGFVSNLFPGNNYYGIDDEAVGYYDDGSVWFQNAPSALSMPSFTAGDVIGVWLDITNKRLALRKNGGNWNNNGANDPNTGFLDVSAVDGTTFYAGVNLGMNGPVCAATANFKPLLPSTFPGAARFW